MGGHSKSSNVFRKPVISNVGTVPADEVLMHDDIANRPLENPLAELSDDALFFKHPALA